MLLHQANLLFQMLELFPDLEQRPRPDQALEALDEIFPLEEVLRIQTVGLDVREHFSAQFIDGICRGESVVEFGSPLFDLPGQFTFQSHPITPSGAPAKARRASASTK